MTSARRRALIAVSGLALAGGATLWLSRVPIATHVIDRELARRGVAGRYAIEDLGFGRQRLTGVVIGDPRAPDLVADWVETETDFGLFGPRLVGVRAGHVRLSGRLADGKLSLGAIDRLLPAGSGGGFALPAIDLDVADARVALTTPQGKVALRLSGRGLLDDGFSGRLLAAAPLLDAGGCALRGLDAGVSVRVVEKAPRLIGPVRATALDCAGARVVAPTVTLDAALSPALDRWRGSARLRAEGVTAAAGRLDGLGGTVSFAGDARRSGGTLALTAARLRAAAASGGATRFEGTWRLAARGATVAGRLDAAAVALAPSQRARLRIVRDATVSTPLAPLGAALAHDLDAAARRMRVTADMALASGATALLTVDRAEIVAATGARASLDGGGIVLGHPAGPRLAGRLTLGGGGLPATAVRLTQAAPGAAVGGTATIARYARDGATLDLTPLSFSPTSDGVRLRTSATLSGPLPGGRVERLSLPLDARLGRGGALTLAPGCAPLRFDRLIVSSLALDRTALTLCPLDNALVRVADGRVSGGARIEDVALRGSLGGTPLRLTAADARLRLADRGFALSDVAALIGPPGRVTRIDAARLDGTLGGAGVTGRFAGAGGAIANVPLVMSAADGRWRFDGGALALDGALTVADQATPARFEPLAARDVTLTLRDGAIAAAGTLHEPGTGTKVADVTIDHRLAAGTGSAHLAVPGITFGDTLQPEKLTRLTFGVIADVRGTVSGAGDIAWSPDGVTSTGRFTTPGTDLAAAFGPVEGIAGTIVFTDLLALASAPDQVATVRSINPGVPVLDGRITYQTLPDTRVRVAQGRWPFAGGTLTLEPTLLDFGNPQERRLTFRVDGMDAGKFLQQFDFKNLSATGTFDGVLPMLFDESGGRIADGRLVARAGGGSIAYLGELTEKDLGFWGNLAFQSLRSLTYRDLAVEMNGPLAGEMVTGVRFAGIRQGQGAKSNFLLRRLTRLPIRFNITIRAPFRGLIDSAASFYDPQRLVKRNLQALIEEQNRRAGTVQPPASAPVAEPKKD
ncbi:YdbH domain-containing protein [Sphingomonas sp. BK235]|uniref:YdbH domain-containing protein n=1 Tax=Sphingomonas sp. BK235 TaxID=2512131 RepID=UPI0010DA63C3|nr:YdbH domain-containing protein [Sphingomonas sp. BK235]TCP35003.1 dicarboxylate transport [Sphingomonas sp. BK235]